MIKMATHRNNVTNNSAQYSAAEMGETANSQPTRIRTGEASSNRNTFARAYDYRIEPDSSDSENQDDVSTVLTSNVNQMLYEYGRERGMLSNGFDTMQPAPPGQVHHVSMAFGRHQNPAITYSEAVPRAIGEAHISVGRRIRVDLQTHVGTSPVCGCPVWVHRRVLFVEHIETCVYNQYLITVLRNESGYTDLCAVKHEDFKYANKIAYQQKEFKRLEHKTESVRLEAKKKKKKANKMRLKGMSIALKNESRSIFTDLEERLTKLKEPLIPEPDSPFVSFMTENMNLDSNFSELAINMAMSTGTYFVGLYMAKDYAMISVLTMQWLQALVPNIHTKLYENLINLASSIGPDREESVDGELMNEALSLDTMRSNFRSAFNLSQNLQAVPFYKGLSKAVALGVLLGWVPQTIPDRSDVVSKGYEMWVADIESRERSSSILDLCMECIMFSLEFLSSVQTGTVGLQFKVPDLLSRGISILAREHLYRDGTLESVNMTPQDFVDEVRTCDELISNYVRANARAAPAVVSAFSRTQFALKKLLADIDVNGVYNKLKVPAHMILFTGPSQIGKSSLTMQCATNVGAWEGFPTTDEYIWNKNTNDKFDSGYMSNKNVIIIDDIACEKPDKVDPTDYAKMFINYSNAMPYVSVQAEADKKGKIPLNHKLVVMTSNNPHLNMQHYMNNPEATYNRIIMVEVKLNKKKYGYPDGKGGFLNEKVDPFKVMEATIDGVPPEDQFFFFPFKWVQNSPSSRKLPDFYKEYLPECPPHGMRGRDFWIWLKKVLADKRKAGEAYRRTMENYKNIPICPECGLMRDQNKTYCKCIVLDDTLRNEALFDDALRRLGFMEDPYVVQVYNTISSIIPNFYVFINSDLIPYTVRRILHGFIKTGIDGSGRLFFKLVLALMKVFTKSYLGLLWLTISLTIMLGVLFAPGGYWLLVFRLAFWLFLFFNFCFWHYFSNQFSICLVRSIVSGDRTAAILYGATRVGLAAMGVLSVLRVLKSIFSKLPNEGALCPTSISEMEERKREINVWKSMPVIPFIPNTDSTTMTSAQFEAKLANNLVSASFVPKGYAENSTTRRVQQNLLFINSNTFLMMGHVRELINENCSVRICRNQHVKGGQWNAYISQLTQVAPDIVLGISSRAYAFADILKFFSEEPLKKSMVCAMLSRFHTEEQEYRILTRTLLYEPQMVSNESATALGSKHVCSKPTQPGDCGSPVVTRSNPFAIVALHACGDGRVSGCFSVTRGDIIRAMEALDQKRQDTDIYIGPAPIVSNGPLLNQYGSVNMEICPNVHFRDVTNFIPIEKDDISLAVLGSAPKFRRQYFSAVQVSPLSRFLEEQGLPNKWGKPKFDSNRNHAKAFQTYLDHIEDIPEVILSYAVDDYIYPICEFVAEHNINLAPLSMIETVNGDGSRFKSRIDMSTSSGLGLSSPKRDHFEVVSEFPRLEYMPKAYVQNEFERVESLLEKGILPGHVFISSLKDEPTPIHKDKVRVFQVGPLVLSLVCRKYLLPLLDFLYGIPLLCEMAQGINCTNDEWHQLGEWLLQKDRSQCIEGDFSSYDIRQSGQSIRACGHIFKVLARKVGYSVTEQKVVETIINEIAFKTFCFNGSVFTIDGYMPSGVPVTIAINGITNALLHRVAYFGICTKYNKEFKPFRSVVHFITMGDDSIGSSIDPDFNMVEIQEQMLAIRMPYTDGHKNANTQRFFPFEDIQFCKRKFVYCDVVDKWIAPIELDSIYKSLHCYMESKTAVLDIVIQNLGSALRELARHGPEIYETNRLKIFRAVEAMDILHMCSMYVCRTYDDWWDVLEDDFRVPTISSLTNTSVRTPGSVDSMESLDYGRVEESTSSIDYSS